MKYDSIRPVRWTEGSIELLDQRLLPEKEVYRVITTTQGVCSAIKDMVVRGAPAIGITAAYGAVIALKESNEEGGDIRSSWLRRLEHLQASRPTAINLYNALEQARRISTEHLDETQLLAWAHEWFGADLSANKTMGVLGAQLLQQNAQVLTHCNAGALATSGYGTALGVIRQGVEQGKINRVFSAETRPWNQGARLTLWEMAKEKIIATLVADSAAASLMRSGNIDWLIVGADSIAMNGDVVNKIGTYSLATLARAHQLNVMVVAPVSTFDLNAKSGSDVIIEHRDESELLPNYYHDIQGISAINPVFDVTPADLISAIVTEKGVIHAPNSLKMQSFIKQQLN